VRVDAFAGETFRGEIYAIEPAVDEQSRTVLLRAHVPNPGVRLKPGMFARVLLVLETREKALIVPEQALVPQGQDRFVYRLVDGQLRLRDGATVTVVADKPLPQVAVDGKKQKAN